MYRPQPYGLLGDSLLSLQSGQYLVRAVEVRVVNALGRLKFAQMGLKAEAICCIAAGVLHSTTAHAVAMLCRRLDGTTCLT